MKKPAKLISLTLAALMLASCLAACGKPDTAGLAPAEKSRVCHPDIEDIDWSVSEKVIEGERMLELSYTNDSDYIVCMVEIKFKERQDLSTDKKLSYYEDMISRLELDVNDEKDRANMEKIKKDPISMHAGSEDVVYPGEVSEDNICRYYSGYAVVRDPAHFDLVTPDIATVRYVCDGDILTVYYDFVNESYSYGKNASPAFYWPNTDSAKKVPRPDADVVYKNCYNDEKSFDFSVMHCSSDDCEAYVEKCKNEGYDRETAEEGKTFSARNEKGIKVTVEYIEESAQMDVSVYVPSEKAF